MAPFNISFEWLPALKSGPRLSSMWHGSKRIWNLSSKNQKGFGTSHLFQTHKCTESCCGRRGDSVIIRSIWTFQLISRCRRLLHVCTRWVQGVWWVLGQVENPTVYWGSHTCRELEVGVVTVWSLIARLAQQSSEGLSILRLSVWFRLSAVLMMMIAFITIKSSLVPLTEGLCAQIYFRFEICITVICGSNG